MLFVDNNEREARLDTCRTCQHFVAVTQSCGPLITEAFTDSKLCGCHMPTKTRLKVASCPLDKWSATISAEDIKAVRHMLENKQDYTNEDLVVWYNKMTGGQRLRTTCTSCNNQMFKELKRLVKSADDE